MPLHVTTGKTWDERRNTSRVKPVPPDAIDAARRTLAHARRTRPDWYVWIENRHNGVHDHAAVRSDGTRAACPAHGCTAPLAP